MPFMSGHSQEGFRPAVLGCGLVSLGGFHLVSLLWRLRGMTGDRVLLALALLVVGIGFAWMWSRLDPIRDTLLLTRHTQGIVIATSGRLAGQLVELAGAQGFDTLIEQTGGIFCKRQGPVEASSGGHSQGGGGSNGTSFEKNGTKRGAFEKGGDRKS